MSAGAIEIVFLWLIALNAIALIVLHIIGDVRTVRRRFRDNDTKRSGKRDRYRPSLSMVVYHTAAAADITQCLDSIRLNPYEIQQIVVVDMLGDTQTQKAVSDYRKQHSDIMLTYRSFANTKMYKQQTGAVTSLINTKLTMVLDSSSVLQRSSLLPVIKTFRNKKIVSIVGQTGLMPVNSLAKGLYTVRQALINNFRRAFSGSTLGVGRALHPAVLLRTYTFKRVVQKHNDAVLPKQVTDYAQKRYYNTDARLIYSVDMQTWVHDTKYKARSVLYVITLLSFVLFMTFILLQLGLYNALPIIAAVALAMVAFAWLSQPKQVLYSRFDKMSVALLAPFGVLLPIAVIYLRLQKTHPSINSQT